MRVALTGATGFLGRYLVWHLLEQGHSCRCWHRIDSDRDGAGCASPVIVADRIRERVGRGW